jgi:hypothetical protein
LNRNTTTKQHDDEAPDGEEPSTLHGSPRASYKEGLRIFNIPTVNLPTSWLFLGAALVVGNGAIWGLPFLIVAAVILVRVVARGQEQPWRLDAIILAACALSLIRAPGQELGALAARLPIEALVLGIGALGLYALKQPRMAPRALWIVLALAAVAGALVIVESPHPRIDVFDLQQGGARALLARENPYHVTYPNPYTTEESGKFFGDERPELRDYPYPPASLLVTTVGYALGGDVRWAMLAAWLVTALGLHAVARRRGHPPEVALAIAVLALVHPRATFVLEQSWTDGLSGCAFVVMLWLLGRESRLAGGLALGAFLALKQYSIVALPLFLRRKLIPRAWWLPALALGAAVTLPFVWIGARDFVEDVVLFQMRQPSRADALSLPGLVQLVSGLRLPGWLAFAGAAGTIAWSWRRLSTRDQLPLAAALAFGGFFVSAKQAFCNYYYLVGVLLLAACASSSAKREAGA